MPPASPTQTQGRSAELTGVTRYNTCFTFTQKASAIGMVASL